MNIELKLAKNIVAKEMSKNGLRVNRIILFGSRARGDYSEESDWDLLVIVKDELTREKKKAVLTGIYRGLAVLTGAYEVIIKTERNFEKMKSIVGSLPYEAELDGITI